GWVGDGVGPFPERGLDEAFGLAVGLWRVRPGADVLEAELAAGPGESPCPVAGTVVGHDAADGDAEACVVGDRGLEKGDGTLLPFVRQDLREGDTRSIVDADVDEFPADTAARGLAIAGDAMAD